MGSPVNFLSNVPSFVLETVSVRITRARSNREEDGRAFSRSSSFFLPFPLPISIPPLFRVFKSTLHQLACPVDVSCPPFSPLARSVCVGRASSSSIRVPGIRIPPGAKKGASCFHLKVPGHSPSFRSLSPAFSFATIAIFAATKIRSRVAFVVIISTCLLYSRADHVPDTQILVAFPSRSFSFNRRWEEANTRALFAPRSFRNSAFGVELEMRLFFFFPLSLRSPPPSRSPEVRSE